ncbi:RNA-binding protein MEX3B-like [Anguilla rostrata]|uniref:RNA-binding protein MEX3B-like n=1 Tax=Anguilla rostrata TaxID=7938 RepID=UPI0030D2BD72
MPSSLFADMDRNVGSQVDALGDQTVLQIALDQLLGLDNDDSSVYDNEPRKKSVNMTECVPVPSSEHVAEIVGRQGCKIKALRAKTNTYIKTPVRGEEPVFVVTGRREDVAMARREIISAAEHFSMIRASRNKNASLNGGGGASIPGPPNLPGQTTIQVRVPYRVVGLVVGPKGATIKRIQQQTHTYIVTPSRDKEPVFEVTGMPENVDRAREEIEAHIAVRTGGFVELTDDNDFHANGTDVGFDLHGHPALWSKAAATTTPTAGRKPFANYRNDSSSSLGSASTDSYFGNNAGSRLADYSPPSPTLSYTASSNGNNNNNNNNNANINGNINGHGDKFVSISPVCTDLTFKSSPGFNHSPATPSAPSLLWSQYDHPAPSGGAPPTVFPAAASANASGGVGNQRAPSRLSPPLHHHHANGLSQHPLARRVCSDPGGGALSFSTFSSCGLSNGMEETSMSGPHLPEMPSDSSASSDSSTSSSSSSSSTGTSRKGSRDCSLCFESEVIAALVPCGHNLFCMECANRICERNNPECPVCHTAVTQAIRIFS